MLTTETLRDEHNGVLAVLDQLERAVTAAEGSAAIPAPLFADIQEFFAIFVDRCHHGKEEGAVFPALGAAGAMLQARLEDEHAIGRRLAQTYAAAVARYAQADMAAITALSAAARAYAAFLRRHIALETDELFPLIERTFTLAGDAEVVREFETIEEEQIGPGTHERLHGMIAALAPRIDAALAGAPSPART